MATIDELFPELVKLVAEPALARGFAPVDTPTSAHGFGTRVARWRRGAEELRLLWDGKEQWINFEYRPAPEHPPALEWTGTLSERYTGNAISDQDVTRLRDGLAAAARSVWARRPAG